MYPFKYRLSLRLFHPDIDPREVTAALRLTPLRSWKRGQQKTTPVGTTLRGTYPKSYWCARLEHPVGIDLSDFLEMTLRKLTCRRKFFEKVRLTGGSVELYVGWFSPSNSGQVLGWELLQGFANLRIDLALDIYAQDQREEEKEEGE